MNIETASENVITMDEAAEAATVPDQHNEEADGPEILPEGSSSAHKYLDLNAGNDMEMNKYQNAQPSVHTEVPEDFPEYHDVPVSGSRCKGNILNIP